MSIHEKVLAFQGTPGEHDNSHSWQHCYRFFSRYAKERIAANRDLAALHLGFYLASWGMYRGSSFLPKYAYTIHLGAIDQLTSPRFSVLREVEFGAGNADSLLVPIVLEAVKAVREAYRPFARQSEARQASDTLVTKIILGTLGSLPACDRYFIAGFKSSQYKYSYVNSAFVEQVLQFCSENLNELREEQGWIERTNGIRYPVMKIVDMYFWQVGYELSQK